MEKPRILSIDDESSFTDLIKQYFEPRGYKITTVADGSQGLDILQTEGYDVVLLDLRMEGMNGREVLRRISELAPKTKIIFISAYSDSGKTKTELLKEGAYAFLEKPLASLKELEYLVNQAAKADEEKGAEMIKLLVVDDEADICDFVQNFFKERKFEVFIAHNGKDALSIVEAREPDIILLDMKMPKMDGIETLKGIKRLNENAKVIMVTAVEDEDKVEEARNLGVIEYIKKPLILEQLERSVLLIAEQLQMGEE